MSHEGVQTISTTHTDMIHDAQFDHFSRRIATASSDTTVKIRDVDDKSGNSLRSLEHDSPVWQVSWADPRFGTILASCTNNGSVKVWKEETGNWNEIYEHKAHNASVNSIAWAPHVLGAIIACASSDGRISTLEHKDDGSWETAITTAHSAGCNAITWASATALGSTTNNQGGQTKYVKKLVTGGADNLVKIWAWSDINKAWETETILEGHGDWVRDVAWEPNNGLPRNRLASCSQDKTVIIWTQDQPNAPWSKKILGTRFNDAVWRVSWSLSGNVLAVSCADNKVTLWKETGNEWVCISDVSE